MKNAIITRTLRLSAEAEERTQKILDRIGSNDFARLIRIALRLTEWAVEEIEKGNAIAAVDKDGRAISIDIYQQP